MTFFDRFRNSTHAQLVGTNPGEWKKHIPESEKKEYHLITAAKIAMMAIGGAAVVGAIVVSAGAFAGVAAVAAGVYGLAAHGQAAIRTDAEKEMGIQKPKHKLRNVGKHLIRLF